MSANKTAATPGDPKSPKKSLTGGLPRRIVATTTARDTATPKETKMAIDYNHPASNLHASAQAAAAELRRHGFTRQPSGESVATR
jgi:hypothetical protein